MENEKTKKHMVLKFLILLVILGIIAGSLYLRSIGTNIIDLVLTYKPVTTKVLEPINFDADSKSSFAIIQNHYVQATKDGVKYSGGSNWNKTYTMNSPIMISEGNIVAISELNNRIVYVFNEKDIMYDVQTDFPIQQFSINRLGYLAIIMRNNDKYIVKVYTPSGEVSTERNFGVEQNYPIATDISEDGKSVAISVLDTSSTNYVSAITFLTVGKEGEAEVLDSLYASIDKSNEIIFATAYMEDNIFIAVSDKTIIAADATTAKIIWEITLNNEITALDMSDGKTIAIGLGDELPGGSDYKSGTAIWYDTSGKKLGHYETAKKIKLINCKSNRVLVYSGKSIYGLTKNSHLLWEHIVLQDVNQMLIFNDLSRMLVAYKNSAQIIDIKAKPNENLEDESKTDGETETQSIEGETTTENESIESKITTENESIESETTTENESIESEATTENTENGGV